MCCILLCPLPDAAASGACLIIISDWRGRRQRGGGDRQSLLRMGIRLGFVRGRRDGRHRARLGRRRVVIVLLLSPLLKSESATAALI